MRDCAAREGPSFPGRGNAPLGVRWRKRIPRLFWFWGEVREEAVPCDDHLPAWPPRPCLIIVLDNIKQFLSWMDTGRSSRGWEGILLTYKMFGPVAIQLIKSNFISLFEKNRYFLLFLILFLGDFWDFLVIYFSAPILNFLEVWYPLPKKSLLLLPTFGFLIAFGRNFQKW